MVINQVLALYANLCYRELSDGGRILERQTVLNQYLALVSAALVGFYFMGSFLAVSTNRIN